MRKGISGLIVAIMLLVISVALAGGFYFWIGSSTTSLKESAETSIERESARQNAAITIPVVANEGSQTKVVIRNSGRVNVDVEDFDIFINGALVESLPEDPKDTVSPGDSVTLESDGNVNMCDRIRVTGEFGTIDEFVYQDDGTCIGGQVSGLGGPSDVSAPSVDASHLPQSPAADDSVVVNTTANDTESSVSSIRIFVDGSLIKTCSTSPCLSDPVVYSDGSHTYYAEADSEGGTGRDPQTGNKTFTVAAADSTPPTVSASHSPTSPVVGEDVNYTVTASDPESDVTRIYIVIDGNLEKTCPNTNSCSIERSYSSEGTHTYRGNADSAGGNGRDPVSGAHSVTVGPSDSTPPTSTISYPSTGSWKRTDFSVKFVDSDADSGLASCEYRILNNGVQTRDWTPRVCSSTKGVDVSVYCTTQGAEKCEVQGRATDNASNTGSTVSTKVGMDYTAPIANAPTHSPSSPDDSQSITITAKGSDSLSGIWRIYIYFDDKYAGYCTSSPCSKSVGARTAGTYDYYSHVINEARNSTRSSTESVTVESTGGSPSGKTIFATSTFNKGDFSVWPDTSSDGVAGADQICQAHANRAGLTGTYRALISDSTVDARNRISNCDLVNTNNERVADNCNDLWDGSLDNPIEYDEYGSYIQPRSSTTGDDQVWTGSDRFGRLTTDCDNFGTQPCACNNWSGSGAGKKGVTGTSFSSWIEHQAVFCSVNYRIYCFET